MNEGILYGISVGPGDPELMTIKAKNRILNVDVLAFPGKDEDSCVAYQIAKKAICGQESIGTYASCKDGLVDIKSENKLMDCQIERTKFDMIAKIFYPVPMTMDEAILSLHYDACANEIASMLREGKSVGFCNLGDATIYGTYMEVHRRIKDMGFETSIIAGVPSFAAISATLQESLCKKDEQLLVHPGMYEMADLKDFHGSVVLMKSAKNIEKNKSYLKDLEAQGKITVKAVSDCGMESQRIYDSVDIIPTDASYFTTMIVHTLDDHVNHETNQNEIVIDKQDVYKNQKSLRYGITTGTCATAATRAAATYLLTGAILSEVSIVTPGGTLVKVPVYMEEMESFSRANERIDEIREATFYVIKESGDDPDVTNHTKIYSTASLHNNSCIANKNDEISNSEKDISHSVSETPYFTDEAYPGIHLHGGFGIGVVTKEGLEQEVGYSAINKVPRQMIMSAASEARELASANCDLYITISAPEGETLAKKTFNPSLGIEHGISILGTSGILEPMSEKAIVDTIEVLIKQQAAMGKKDLLVTPGHYGQGYVTDVLKMSLENSVKCSNFIGETIDLAVSYEFERMLLVGNLGKLVKLASGVMNTHSKVADARMETMITHASLCGASREVVEKLYACINTDTALDVLHEAGLMEDVMKSVIAAIHKRVSKRAGDNLKIGVVLFSEKYGFLGQTEYAKEILEWYIS